MLDVLRDRFDARDDAEVDQREPLGLVAQDVVERLAPTPRGRSSGGGAPDDMLPGEDANADASPASSVPSSSR